MRSSILVIALVVSGLAPQAAPAQDSTDAAIQQSFENFGASLDSQGAEMSQMHDTSEQAAANRNLTNMQAAQDTAAAAERQFQDGQEQMVLGGGAYNSQGFIWGSPWGGMGGGGGSALGSGNLIPSVPATSWSDSPAIRHPGYDSYNSVLRSYYNRPRRSSFSSDW